MNKLSYLIFVLLLTCLMVANNYCTYKNAQDVYPTCPTANMSYKMDIVPILNTNHCYDCHDYSTASAGGGSKNVMIYYWQVERFVNDSNGKILLGMISDPSSTNFNHMPQGPYPHLSLCDISKLSAWVQQGAKNN